MLTTIDDLDRIIMGELSLADLQHYHEVSRHHPLSANTKLRIMRERVENLFNVNLDYIYLQPTKLLKFIEYKPIMRHCGLRDTYIDELGEFYDDTIFDDQYVYQIILHKNMILLETMYFKDEKIYLPLYAKQHANQISYKGSIKQLKCAFIHIYYDQMIL